MSITKVGGVSSLFSELQDSGRVIFYGSMEMDGLQQALPSPGPSPGLLPCPHKPRVHFPLVPSGRKIPECALDGDGLERDKGQITRVLCMHAVVRKGVQAPREPFSGAPMAAPLCMFSSPTRPPGFAGLVGLGLVWHR